MTRRSHPTVANPSILRRGVVGLVAALLLAACSSRDPAHFVVEQPVGSNAWVEIDGAPDWVTTPPAEADHLVFVVEGKSNLRGIAATGRRPSADKAARLRVTELLAPAVGVDLATHAADGVESWLKLRRRACKEEILTRDKIPGNTLCTAWALWDAALDDIVAPLPEDVRPAARAALAAGR